MFTTALVVGAVTYVAVGLMIAHNTAKDAKAEGMEMHRWALYPTAAVLWLPIAVVIAVEALIKKWKKP